MSPEETSNSSDTDRRKEEELRLRVMNLQVLTELAGSVAHDLSNALLAITLMSEVYGGSVEGDTDKSDHASRINQEAESAGLLARKFRNYLRPAPKEREEISLNDLMASLLDDLAGDVAERYQIEFRREDDIFIVMTESWIDLMTRNLFANACESMPDGGSLIVETELVNLDDSFVDSNKWARSGKFVLLTVADSGTGIDRSLMPLVVEPFFTTKSNRVGHGIGLTATRGMVAHHDGLFHIESEPGQGTRVSIYLPVMETG